MPDSEELIRQHDKIRLLVMLDDFKGWNAGALWEDIKWDARHFNHVERIAVVGEKQWQKWMTGFCKASSPPRRSATSPGARPNARGAGDSG